jgi:hypothetical protein
MKVLNARFSDLVCGKASEVIDSDSEFSEGYGHIRLSAAVYQVEASRLNEPLEIRRRKAQ